MRKVGNATLNTKILLIARVSDVEQRRALPAQRLRLEEYARKLGVVEVYYFEFDESAYKTDRHKFAELIGKIRAEPAGQIVVFDKIDRFTRDASQKEVRIVSGLVNKGHIELHFPSDNLVITKDSPATDLFRLGIGMLLAKYYSDASRDNVRRRFAQMRHDGIWMHKAPIGYKNVSKRSETGREVKSIAIDPERAPHVVRAFEMRAQSLSYGMIARKLAESGFRSTILDAALNVSAIASLLNNKFYIGVMTSGGKEYRHKYPSLISKDLFHKCQLVKQQRQRRPGKSMGQDYIFKGVIHCGHCRHAVSSYTTKGNVYLRCTQRNCRNPNISQALVLNQLRKELAKPRMPSAHLKKMLRHLQDQLANKKHTAYQISQAMENTNMQLDTLYADRLAGRIDTGRHDKYACGLESEKTRLQKQLEPLTGNTTTKQTAIAQLVDLSQRATELFEKAETSLKNKMLKFIFSNLELRDKKLKVSWNLSCWVARQISQSASKSQKHPAWWGWEDLNHRPRHYQ